MDDALDILILNGLIHDSTGKEPFVGHVGIRGDRISLLHRADSGSSVVGHRASRIIDAKGLVVAPGFIDTHGHSEFTVLADPRAEGKISQGITTEINGNCGLSAAPLFGEALDQREADLRELGIRERWSTFGEYFRLLEDRRIALNFATLTGHGNLRACVAGYRDRKISDGELRAMQNLLANSIGDGSFGLSTGLIYPPGIYADTEELVALCGVLREQFGDGGDLYASHLRSEGDQLLEAISEAITIGRRSGVRVHISHLKTSGRRNWNKLADAISLIEKALYDGVKITCDRYPYTAASTDLDSLLPSWTFEGGAEAELRRLQDPELRARVKAEMGKRHPDDEYWERVIISSVATEKNRWMEGENIRQIARREGSDPLDIVLRTLIEERLRVGAIFETMSKDNLMRILSLPYVMVGTDSSARSFSGPTRKGKPHPRGFGSFPRFLSYCVPRIEGMDLGEAIRKVTSLPARTFGISDRGMIRHGAYADLVVFDPQTIRDRSTFAEPFLKSEGVVYVIVNGELSVSEGEFTGVRAGRVLRNVR